MGQEIIPAVPPILQLSLSLNAYLHTLAL